MIVGIISDTHGLLRRNALAALQGSDAIIHAGDIGPAEILEQLRGIAPVTVVRGNVDTLGWCHALNETEVLEIGGCSFYVLHDVGSLDIDPAAAGFDAVVYGHSHRPDVSERGAVLFLNPGSAGPRRLRLPISIARVTIEDGRPAAKLIELDDES